MDKKVYDVVATRRFLSDKTMSIEEVQDLFDSSEHYSEWRVDSVELIEGFWKAVEDAIDEGLSPCPFCGARAELIKDEPVLPNGAKDEMYYVKCTNRMCQIRTMSWYPKNSAIRTWNNRR